MVNFRQDIYIVINQFKAKIKSAQRVLDFGCRVDHYTIPVAKAVRNEGIVYVVMDKEQQALNELEQEAVYVNLSNKSKPELIELYLIFPTAVFLIIESLLLWLLCKVLEK